MKSNLFQIFFVLQINLCSWRSQSEDLIERIDDEKLKESSAQHTVEMVKYKLHTTQQLFKSVFIY